MRLNELVQLKIILLNCLQHVDENHLLRSINDIYQPTTKLPADLMAKSVNAIIRAGFMGICEQVLNNCCEDAAASSSTTTNTDIALYRNTFEELLSISFGLKRFPQTVAALKQNYLYYDLTNGDDTSHLNDIVLNKCHRFETNMMYFNFLLNINCDKAYILNVLTFNHTSMEWFELRQKINENVINRLCAKYVSILFSNQHINLIN